MRCGRIAGAKCAVRWPSRPALRRTLQDSFTMPSCPAASSPSQADLVIMHSPAHHSEHRDSRSSLSACMPAQRRLTRLCPAVIRGSAGRPRQRSTPYATSRSTLSVSRSAIVSDSRSLALSVCPAISPRLTRLTQAQARARGASQPHLSTHSLCNRRSFSRLCTLPRPRSALQCMHGRVPLAH